ncbi:MAG: lysophospholipid acyltransferase family protein [Phycisphaerales bacterium]
MGETRDTGGESRGSAGFWLAHDLGRYASFAALLGIYRYHWRGGRNMPPSGPVLVVANHQSYLDPPIVGVAVPRRMMYVARMGLFNHPVFAAAIRSFGAVPIREEGGDTAAMKAVLGALKRDRPVLIFPEGSRSSDGTVGEFKRGVAVIVKRAKCPVLPVGIEGAHDAWPRRSRPKLFGKRVACVVGEPIASESLLDEKGHADMDRLRLIVDGLRLEARDMLRRDTRGAYPPRGLPDAPAQPWQAES